MGKIKIGVLVFTKNVILSGRADKKKYNFDSYSYVGLNKILNELKYEYEYCSSKNINKYDYVLISLISYLDLLNIINNVPKNKKCKIIVGGPACNNIRGIIDYIDIACFGRCDNNEINDIIDGKKINNVWRKSDDPLFENNYFVGIPTISGLNIKEKAVGCSKKCFFCFYSWWNGYIEKEKSNVYESGFSNYEDYFQNLNWEHCKRGGVTGLDGITENTRERINKKISYSQIKKTLLNSNDINFENKKLRLKVYLIAGYPWEDKNEIEKLDLIKVIKEISSKIKNKIVIKLHISHFIPFQKTPFWYFPFNFNNYNKWTRENPILIDTENIQIYSGGSFNPSPGSAAKSVICQRVFNNDQKIMEIIASRKFDNMNTKQKIKFLKTYYEKFFIIQEKETISNIKTSWNYKIKLNYNGKPCP